MNRISLPNFYFRIVDVSDVSPSYLETLNDKSYMKFSQNSLLEHSYNSQKKYIETFLHNDKNFFMGAFDNVSNVLMATVTALPYARQPLACNAGLLVLKPFAGIGVGLKVWQKWISILVHDKKFEAVYAGTSRSNKGMIRICEKSNMQPISREANSSDSALTFVYFSKQET